MSENATAESGPSPPLSLNVTFTFAHQWRIGPDGRLSGFPPGGGDALRTIEIGPVDLRGKSAAEVAEIEARRASDMALVSQAIAVASVQFAEALAALKG